MVVLVISLSESVRYTTHSLSPPLCIHGSLGTKFA